MESQIKTQFLRGRSAHGQQQKQEILLGYKLLKAVIVENILFLFLLFDSVLFVKNSQAFQMLCSYILLFQ